MDLVLKSNLVQKSNRGPTAGGEAFIFCLVGWFTNPPMCSRKASSDVVGSNVDFSNLQSLECSMRRLSLNEQRTKAMFVSTDRPRLFANIGLPLPDRHTQIISSVNPCELTYIKLLKKGSPYIKSPIGLSTSNK